MYTRVPTHAIYVGRVGAWMSGNGNEGGMRWEWGLSMERGRVLG